MTSGPSRARLWRALVTLLILVGSGLLASTFTPQLGIDLRGGTQFELETSDLVRDGEVIVNADAEATDRTLEILRGRVDALGVAEPNMFRVGENRIRIELPGVQDPAEARSVVGRTAQLYFHLVQSVNAPDAQPVDVDLARAEEEQAAEQDQDATEDETAAPEDEEAPEADAGLPLPGEAIVLQEASGDILTLPQSDLGGTGVSDASHGQPENQPNQWVVNVDFESGADGAVPWQELVANACGAAETDGSQRIAIVLDYEVISSPRVNDSLCMGAGSSTQISGDFTLEEAEQLAIMIKGGALPVPIEIISEGTIGPTLGEAAIDASWKAAAAGLAVTALFITIVYRFVGFLAAVALSTYALISFAILAWIGATLTLPGLAGFVLAIGLAIDANVLVYERAREEYVERKAEGLPRALGTGFNKAWSAIIDANVTTIIAAALLFTFATGAVRGFGVTLIIGTLASMISALIIARTFTEFFVSRAFAKNHPDSTGITSAGPVRRWLETTDLDLTKKAGTWVLVTVAIAAIALSGILVRGLNLGVEFTGGQEIEYSITEDADVEDIRVAVGEAGYPNAVVQETSSDGQDNVTVRTDDISDDEMEAIRLAVASVTGEAEQVNAQFIGPNYGEELRNRALMAFAIAIGAQMLYLAWRFRWTYAVAVQASMFSVVLMVVGFFAWTGRLIDSVFLAAILSIIGLAINDTIVVFDRIREETRDLGSRTFREVVNKAVVLTLPRTINTGLGAMFILAALAVFGGDTLNNFAVALMLGLGVGILSTIFTASAIAVLLEERWPYDAERDREKKTAVDPYAEVGAGGRDLPDPPNP